jgi:cell division protein FtsL
MNKLIDYLIELLQNMKNMDRVKLAQEFKEIAYQMNRQLFSQIPGVSAIVGILVGSWVASTFTNSPIKGYLSSWGLMKGGTHVVSTTTYRFLSVILPIIVTAITAYIVQKALKTYREKRLEGSMAHVAQLGQEVQSELRDKMSILDKAKEAGLISENEYQTKMANLYQAYSRNDHSSIEEIIIKKLES